MNEFGGTLFTIAKDVKLQIEFNPAKVKAYRLIGYENRMLKSEDFNNDKKDAGELGSGHTVTALYEIIPVGVDSEFDKIDELKYQTNKVEKVASKTNELRTSSFAIKNHEEVSKLIVHPLIDDNTALAKTSNNFRGQLRSGFWNAAARFRILQRYSYEKVAQLAQASKGEDKEGYRIEFINMVKSMGLLARKREEGVLGSPADENSQDFFMNCSSVFLV